MPPEVTPTNEAALLPLDATESIDFFGLQQTLPESKSIMDDAQELFTRCDGLMRAMVQSQPKLYRKQFLEGEPIDLPAITVKPEHTFRIRRSTKPGDSEVTYAFQRLGHGYETTGFELSQLTRGDTSLYFFTSQRDSVMPGDALNDQQVKVAQEHIDKYAKKLGQTPKKLLTAAAIDIQQPPSRSRRLGQLGLAAVLSLTPLPGFMSTWFHLGVSVPKPWAVQIGDDIINRSEHVRQGFDAKHLLLPIDNPIIHVGETNILGKTPPLPTGLADALDHAPVLDADSNHRQDLYDGPRRLIHLEDKYRAQMPSTFCEDIKIHINGGDSLRVANITPDIANSLQFDVNEESIVICNVGQSALNMSALEHIYVQVVKG